MPQLDIFTFFPQVFWGFLFFFFQFFIVSYYFLPLLASTLKFKQKYLTTLFQKETSSLATESSLHLFKNNDVLLTSIKEAEKIFENISKNCNSSIKNVRSNLLLQTFGNINYQISKIPFLVCAIPTFYRSVFTFNFSKTKHKSKAKKLKK